MLPADAPLTRDLVLIGGGHAHALVLRMWGMNPLPGARLTLIDPNPTAPYTGMLPGFVAGHYRREELEIDLVRLCRFAGARLVIGRATAIDPEARRITVAGRGDVGYDVAAIDIGIHAAMPDVPGFREHAVAVKPLGPFASAWAAFLERVDAAEVAPQAAVIGGGIAGIEIALAMAHALRGKMAGAEITLLEAEDRIADTTPAARNRLSNALKHAGVRICTQARIARIAPDFVALENGEHVASAFTVGAAGARAYSWPANGGLDLTEDGFLRVGPDLRVEGQDAVFASGDCAHLTRTPRPKAGVFAVRAAPVLFHNLRAALSGGRMRAFRPQRYYLKLVSLGEKSALAEKGGLALAAPALWRWKDRIDRRFIAKFTDLPQMPLPKAPRLAALSEEDSADPLCGGCGSKVAPGALAATLAALPAPRRADILSGPGDDAAVIETGGVRQVLTTDHLRAFTEDFGVMARVSALHALGDIWAMGAQPQAAMISIVLPRMSAKLQARSLEEIMRVAGDTLRAAGADVVGGHSTMGAEMTIGLSVTGLLDGPAITVAGARAGDALVLTRPIGSGTLLAAEMRGLAQGRDIVRLFEALQHPQSDAAALLRGAHAMTDVTGFGLAGHLAAICRASGLGAEIEQREIPVFSGAETLAAAGLRSTIWAANRAAAPVEGAEGALGALLHDPQTAGGFLAAVPEDDAATILPALRAAGHNAARIGKLVAGRPVIRVV